MHTLRNEQTIYESITDDEKHERLDTLGFYDVICGRNKFAFDNIGNRRFRVLIALAHDKYANAPSRAHKSIVIKDIVDSVHNGGGRFLQRLGCSWVELDEKQTHDKVGHALRDMAVASKAKSSNKQGRNNSMDFSDQSNSSKLKSTVSNKQCAKTDQREGVVDGYIVSFPTIEKTESIDINFDDFVFDDNDNSFEPITWPVPSQSHRQHDNVQSSGGLYSI